MSPKLGASAHYKPEFPARNDPEWLRTTKAAFSDESPVFSYSNHEIHARNRSLMTRTGADHRG
jgi:hypothetical protein